MAERFIRQLHSYRGDYSELAFEPRENVMIGSMLADARDALGRTFTGYKGGEYVNCKGNGRREQWLTMNSSAR